MAAAMCQALPSFIQIIVKNRYSFSVSSDFYEKYIVTNYFSVSTHNSYCSLENCKFHILLIGSCFDQILQRLGNWNVISSTGEVFYELDHAVHHNLKWKGAEKRPSVAKKRLLRKKCKLHYLCSNQKLASTQTVGSAILERVRKVQNSKYEHELLKINDCFINGLGFVNSDHVNFSIKIF